MLSQSNNLRVIELLFIMEMFCYIARTSLYLLHDFLSSLTIHTITGYNKPSNLLFIYH